MSVGPVFPMSKFNPSQFTKAGIPTGEWEWLRARADLLPNLQLLRSDDNQAGGKAAKMPKEWLNTLSVSAKKRYSAQGVKYLPDGLVGFDSFWTKRRADLRVRIKRMLAQ
jgi:hypothetical protein